MPDFTPAERRKLRNKHHAASNTPKLTPAQRHRLVKLYLTTDATIADLARRFRVNETTAAYHLKRAAAA